MYQLLRSVFFLLDPEKAHEVAMTNIKRVYSLPFGKSILNSIFLPNRKDLHCDFLNLKFDNPIGLGAGFDKNAVYLNVLEALGFGFVEIGTVTPKTQDGNPKPRVFRLPMDKALINRMGFNNDGADIIAKRLEDWRSKKNGTINNRKPLIVGGNIGKNKVTPNEDAWKDYAYSFNKLHSVVDYFVVNVSSPNTPGLRALQSKDALRKILLNLEMINNGKAKAKPILLKIAPDLNQEDLDDVIELAMEIKLDGIVAANTTISRTGLVTGNAEVQAMGEGGLSGKPLTTKSTNIVSYIADQTKGVIPIIASGGIFTANDVKEKQAAGASMFQIWTGFIYEGPSIVKKICKSL